MKLCTILKYAFALTAIVSSDVNYVIANDKQTTSHSLNKKYGYLTAAAALANTPILAAHNVLPDVGALAHHHELLPSFSNHFANPAKLFGSRPDVVAPKYFGQAFPNEKTEKHQTDSSPYFSTLNTVS